MGTFSQTHPMGRQILVYLASIAAAFEDYENVPEEGYFSTDSIDPILTNNSDPAKSKFPAKEYDVKTISTAQSNSESKEESVEYTAVLNKLYATKTEFGY